MKKTQVALAALALVASTAALADVKIGGVIDVGVGMASKNGGVGGAYIENGAYNDHSSIDINVSEDLGNGMKAHGMLGMGFNANGQSDDPGVGRGFTTANTSLGVNNNALFNRQAYVGLSGDFGSVEIGRQLSPFVLSNVLMQNYIGMFGVGRMVLAGAGGTAGAFFMNNAIQYTTPSIGGFTLTVFGTTPNGTRGNQFINGDEGDRYNAYRLGGAVGPFNLTAAYHKQKGGYSGYNIGGTMQLMEGLTGSIGFIQTESAANLKVGSWNIGAAYALTGSTTLTVQHASNDNNGGNLNLSNIMLANALSKRTTVYSGFGWGSAGMGASVGTFGGAVDSGSGATSAAAPNDPLFTSGAVPDSSTKNGPQLEYLAFLSLLTIPLLLAFIRYVRRRAASEATKGPDSVSFSSRFSHVTAVTSGLSVLQVVTPDTLSEIVAATREEARAVARDEAVKVVAEATGLPGGVSRSQIRRNSI